MNFKITTSLNKDKWNNFLDYHKYSSIFQRHEIADVYNNTKNMSGLRFVVFNKKDDILACMTIKIESKKFLKSLTSIAIIENAPLYEDSEQGREAAKFLIEHYNKYIKKKALYSNVKIGNNTFLVDLYESNNYRHSISLNFEINLNRTVDEVFKSIHKSRRKNIKKAAKKGITIVEAKEDLIQEFYRILEKTYDTIKIPVPDISYFNSAFTFMPNNVKLFLAKYQDRFIAGRIVLVYNQKILDWYTGAVSEYLNMFPNDALIWYILEWGCKNGYKIFDFGGAGVPEKEYGVREFKRRFGGELIKFDTFIKIHRPALLWFVKRGYKVYNSLLRK